MAGVNVPTSPKTLSVLAHVPKYPYRLTAHLIAQRMGEGKNKVSAHLTHLYQQGMVIRRREPGAIGGSWFEITESGRAVLDKVTF